MIDDEYKDEIYDILKSGSSDSAPMLVPTLLEMMLEKFGKDKYNFKATLGSMWEMEDDGLLKIDKDAGVTLTRPAKEK